MSLEGWDFPGGENGTADDDESASAWVTDLTTLGGHTKIGSDGGNFGSMPKGKVTHWLAGLCGKARGNLWKCGIRGIVR